MKTPNLNTLLEGPSRMRYYTDLRMVFEAIGGRQQEFNWLLTDVSHSGPRPFITQGPYWFSGDALTRIVADNDGQFSWAVLSGFARDLSLDLDRLEVEPAADGNPGFWVAHPQIQHPLAEVEIVCWDSGSTLLFCREQHRSLVDSFRSYFPEAIDLDLYNQETIARQQM